MHHLIQPNRWSCLPTSFAMACNVPLEKILEIIGHDGSQIIWPELPEPKRRRTFHVQECIWAAWKLGFCVTTFEAAPQLAVSEYDVIELLTTYDYADLLSRKGVMTGIVNGNRHAVAYNDQVVYDPNGTIYKFKHHNFLIETFCIFNERTMR